MAGSEFRKANGWKSSFNKDTVKSVLNAADDLSMFGLEEMPSREIPAEEKDQREACRYLAASDTDECVRATKELLDFAALTVAPPVIAVANFSRILRDPRNKAGLFSAARKALDQIGGSDGPLSAHFFDDLVKGFKESGMADSEARDRAWDVAYLYSVGGPNLLLRAARWEIQGFPISTKDVHLMNTNALGAQSLIEAMVQLDSQPAQGRSVYSLPAAANFPCDSGKSYHFWMTAYLARYLRKKGYGEEVAAKVAYALAVAYQLKPIELPYGLSKLDASEPDGRRQHSQRKSASETDFARFGTIENGIRIDLNLAAAGAVYGASDGKVLKDLSQGFRQSISDAGLSPNGTKSTSGVYEEWLVRLKPKAILDYYQK